MLPSWHALTLAVLALMVWAPLCVGHASSLGRQPLAGVETFARPNTAYRVRQGLVQGHSAARTIPTEAYVFVTNAATTAALNGLEGADAMCDQQAEAAGLGASHGRGPYMAWLSDGTGASPATRFKRVVVPYVLVDGTHVASGGWEQLTSGSGLQHAINLTASGDPAPLDSDHFCGNLNNVSIPTVRTNTQSDGTPVPFVDDCQGWTSIENPTPTQRYAHGQANLFREPVWSVACEIATIDCSRKALLYCFEQPPDTAAPTLSPTRRPTHSPTKTPTKTPTLSPTKTPTLSPTLSPTKSPTAAPTMAPTMAPTAAPTSTPSPTASPTFSPTQAPTTTPTTGTPVPVVIADEDNAKLWFGFGILAGATVVFGLIGAAILGIVYFVSKRR